MLGFLNKKQMLANISKTGGKCHFIFHKIPHNKGTAQQKISYNIV